MIKNSQLLILIQYFDQNRAKKTRYSYV